MTDEEITKIAKARIRAKNLRRLKGFFTDSVLPVLLGSVIGLIVGAIIGGPFMLHLMILEEDVNLGPHGLLITGLCSIPMGLICLFIVAGLIWIPIHGIMEKISDNKTELEIEKQWIKQEVRENESKDKEIKS